MRVGAACPRRPRAADGRTGCGPLVALTVFLMCMLPVPRWPAIVTETSRACAGVSTAPPPLSLPLLPMPPPLRVLVLPRWQLWHVRECGCGCGGAVADGAAERLRCNGPDGGALSRHAIFAACPRRVWPMGGTGPRPVRSPPAVCRRRCATHTPTGAALQSSPWLHSCRRRPPPLSDGVTTTWGLQTTTWHGAVRTEYS